MNCYEQTHPSATVNIAITTENGTNLSAAASESGCVSFTPVSARYPDSWQKARRGCRDEKTSSPASAQRT
jgi:hypothetical protein